MLHHMGLGLFVAAFMLVSTNISVAAETVKRKLTLVLVCDIYNMVPNRANRGGAARIAAVLKAEKARGNPVLIAHAGDAISPSLMSGLDKGAHMIDLLNQMPLDVFTPGNHEFDFGRENFVKRMGEAKFPVLAANLADENGKPLKGIGASKLYEFDGFKVGVIGLTADDSVTKSSPGNLQFSSSARTTFKLAAKLRKQGADLVVVVAHANRKIDRELIDEKAADVILSGDDHDLQLSYDGKRVFVEAMEDGLYVVAVDLDIQIKTSKTKRKTSWWPNFRLLDTADFEPDAQTAKKVAAYQAVLSKELDVTIGKTATEMDSRNAAVRGGESAIGNMMSDAIRQATGADVALLNGGGFRGKKVYEAGSGISRRDVLKELPFGNKTFVLEVTGAQILKALEAGLSNAEILTGRFPSVSGMTVRADLTKPAGKRVVSVKVGVGPLVMENTYKLATNDFLARGGDGYGVLKRGKILVGSTDGKLIANHVMAYLAKHKTIAPRIEGRIIVARGKSAE